MSLSPALLEEIAGLYSTSASRLRPATGGHFSHVYEYDEEGRACILRISPPHSDLDLHSMRSILEWLAFLSARGGPVVPPLRSRGGNLIESLESEGNTYLATAFEKAPGILAETFSPKDWDDELFQALGRALGKCHSIAQEYVPPREDLKRPEWELGGSCFHPAESLTDADPLILKKREKVLASIRELPRDRENYGLAHLDLHFANFYVEREKRKITFFDFDDCAYGWYLMDIAMLLFDILVLYRGPDKERFAGRFLENLLLGYAAEKTLDLFLITELPRFTKLLEIGVYLMLYRFYNPETADEWVSSFMPGRRARIEEERAYVELNFRAVALRAIGE